MVIVQKKSIALLIFIFVNFIFAVKYTSRITSFYIVVATGLAVFYLLLWYKKKMVSSLLQKWKLSSVTMLALLVLASVFLLYFIPKETLRVDRWSVIATFWEQYFDNKYAYFAKSFDGNNPGPMPFYFILALPFYAIGELGFFALSGIALFAYVLKKSETSYYKSIIFLLTATSLFYYWEICARSNIFVNGTMILASILYFFKHYDKKVKSNLIFGILTGLLLSTRNVFVIPYIILLLYALRKGKIDFKNICYMGTVSILTFCLTFVPFVWNHWESFLLVNPFVIQSSFLMPFEYTLIFIAAAIAIAFVCHNQADVYFYAALILFLTISFYFGYTIVKFGLSAALFDSRCDISYFLLCLPFALYYLSIDTNTIKSDF